MLISIWSDKGGTSKTTTALIAASYFRDAQLLDLDKQRDLCAWAAPAKRPCEWLRLYDDKGRVDEKAVASSQQRLIAAAESEDLCIVDSPPGDAPERMMGMAFSRLVIVPTRDGHSDLRALNRALQLVATIRENGNPELMVAVILGAAKDCSRMRGVADGLSVAAGFTYLGAVKDRAVYKEAYAKGLNIVGEGGPAREESEAAMSRLVEVLPELARWAPVKTAKAA